MFSLQYPPTPEIYTLSLHDALPISSPYPAVRGSETYYLDSAGSTEVMEVSARENATAREKVSDRLELMKIGLDEKKDRKSTRLNSSHTVISYAVFCLKKKKIQNGDE